MTNPIIPAEAVEAAADALVASKLGDHPGINGEEFVEAAIAALEAAAPYIEKKAYERGWGAGFRHTSQAYRAAAEPAPYMLNNDGEK